MSDEVAAVLAERRRIVEMLEVEAEATAETERRMPGRRPASAAGVLRYAAKLVGEGYGRGSESATDG